VYVCECIYRFFLKEFAGFLSFLEAVTVYWYWSASTGLCPAIILATKHGTDRGAEGYARWLSTEIQSKAAVSFIMLEKNEVKYLIKQVISTAFYFFLYFILPVLHCESQQSEICSNVIVLGSLPPSGTSRLSGTDAVSCTLGSSCYDSAALHQLDTLGKYPSKAETLIKH